ncbi:MAG: phosphonate ABC transporter, permease protein PhnE [Desulfohalobiaceae bacterium]|nr:phosphonate ABC transporter, permease protein PhnE [Desulfohalobiaceae bacterium]
MSHSDAEAHTLRPSWRPRPTIRNPWLRWSLLIGCGFYIIYAIGDVHLNPERFISGIPRVAEMLGVMLPPDFSRWDLLFSGILESIQMAIISTALGIVLGIPVAVGASRNLVPGPVYALFRGYIGMVRTLPEVLIAIFFVKAIGFGAFAGMLTLTTASTAFVGKLLAEEIEAIDPGQVEAIRATGAGWSKVLIYGIQPQVLPRYIGLSIYRWDINFRESVILGIVGAGGIGATLYNAFGRYEYDFGLAILLVMIVVVLIAEWGSGEIRSRIQ